MLGKPNTRKSKVDVGKYQHIFDGQNSMKMAVLSIDRRLTNLSLNLNCKLQWTIQPAEMLYIPCAVH